MGCLCYCMFSSLAVPSYCKLHDKKNGLDIYKSNYGKFSVRKTFCCPICDKYESAEEINIILENGPIKLYQLKEELFRLIINYEIVDIFERLEIIEKQKEDILNTFDEKRYYKHTCEKKKVSCYIIIYYEKSSEISDKFYIDKEYKYSEWKNNENIKNTLLNERQKKYEELQQKKVEKQREEKIQKIKDEWNEITFKREEDAYNKALQIVDKKIRYYSSIQRESEFGSTKDLMNIYDFVKDYFKYFSGKYRIIQYISKYSKLFAFSKDFILFEPKMSQSEKEEYTQFYNEKIKNIDLEK